MDKRVEKEESRKQIEDEIIRLVTAGKATSIPKIAAKLEIKQEKVRKIIEESDRIQFGN